MAVFFCVFLGLPLTSSRVFFFANRHLKLALERSGLAPGVVFEILAIRHFRPLGGPFGPVLGGVSRDVNDFGPLRGVVFRSCRDAAFAPFRGTFSANLPGTLARFGPSPRPTAGFRVFLDPCFCL